jgi:hypothetical protein
MDTSIQRGLRRLAGPSELVSDRVPLEGPPAFCRPRLPYFFHVVRARAFGDALEHLIGKPDVVYFFHTGYVVETANA